MNFINTFYHYNIEFYVQNQAERGEVDEEVVYDQDLEINNHLHTLRLSLLEKFINHIPNLYNIGGIRSIPFFQVRFCILYY